jgi:hypothetical protein
MQRELNVGQGAAGFSPANSNVGQGFSPADSMWGRASALQTSDIRLCHVLAGLKPCPTLP